MSGTQSSQKETLRRAIVSVRKLIPNRERTGASHTVCQRLLDRIEWSNAKTVCLYISKPEEMGTMEIFAAAFTQKKTVAVPKTQNDHISVHQVSSIRDLTAGKHNILEPKKSCNVIRPGRVDLFIVPGIVFDKHGYRLGWGKGYYDKLLADVSAAKIGLAYDVQIVARVPHTSYDIPMTTVITERNIYG